MSPPSLFTETIPLSLYIHIPWCEQKCPYCDFNSYPQEGGLPEEAYLEALLSDLERDLPQVWGRRLISTFIGGGTPSLLSAGALERLLNGVRARVPFGPDTEISLEANPGTVEAGRFAEYRSAGINRLSIGIQSFQDAKLESLGRIHDSREAVAAIEAADAAGFDNLNLDLMFGLPGQSLDDALADLETAISLAPTHISHYQLTLEKGTPFYRRPPPLPAEAVAWEMQEVCRARLNEGGYERYEISAYARKGRRCMHNINYWELGDYLGIGAGAHAKITNPATGLIARSSKIAIPEWYLSGGGQDGFVADDLVLREADLPLEFMLNTLRLTEGVPTTLFEKRTGLAPDCLQEPLRKARERGLMLPDSERFCATPLGLRYLNELLELFVAD